MKTKMFLFWVVFAEICSISTIQAQLEDGPSTKINTNMIGIWVRDSLRISEIGTDNKETIVNYNQVKDIIHSAFDRIELGSDNPCKLKDRSKEISVQRTVRDNRLSVKAGDKEWTYQYSNEKGSLILNTEFYGGNVAGLEVKYHLQMWFHLSNK